MSNILVTGSLGFVGSHLCRILAARGHSVVGCDLYHDPQESGYTITDAGSGLRYMRADVSDFRQLDRFIKACPEPDFVYHLAAEFGRWNGEDFYEQLWRTNAIGTKNVIRLQEHTGFRLVHFSSSEVYGDFDGQMIESVMDDHPIRQLNDYAMTKWVNEMQVRNSAKLYGTRSVIVRLFNTYGPGERYSPYRSVNCRFMHCAKMGIPWKVFRGHSRTSSYITDTVNTLANIADNFHSGETYNICGNQRHTIEELSDAVVRVTGCDPGLAHIAEPEQMTTRHKEVSAAKAIRDLGHSPKIDLRTGLKLTWEWLRQSNAS